VVHKYLLYSKLHQDFTRFSIKSPSFTQGPWHLCGITDHVNLDHLVKIMFAMFI
jgi:hypothetical protein